ncbi:MAG: hypothetical protein ACRECE_04145, partial [Xanthobacteraceae bacterium]
MVSRRLREIITAVVGAIFLVIGPVAPAAVAAPANGLPASSDAILRWINDYRHRPDPNRLPAVVHALSQMQAFKDAETCGAYVGFIAGVLGSNPTRAQMLVDKMLSIAPGDRW